MTAISLLRNFNGTPNIVTMVTDQTDSAITTAGFFLLPTTLAAIELDQNGDFEFLPTDLWIVSSATGIGIFTYDFSTNSLVEFFDAGSVIAVLPTTANAISHFTNTSGTISSSPANIFNLGNIAAGQSGTAGVLQSFPATATTGSLILKGVSNSGDFITTISNASMGQASVISIPDPGTATANFAVVPAGLLNTNLVQASGTQGLLMDAGISTTHIMLTNALNVMNGSGQVIPLKGNGTEAGNIVNTVGQSGTITTSSLTTAGGANYVITMNNAKILTSSQVFLQLISGTNSATYDISLTCNPVSGSCEILIFNNTASTALNGNIQIAYLIQ